jgi:hypothetical protein
MTDGTSGTEQVWPGIDEPGQVDLRTDVAHSARIYDYLLGGKDNYAVDRAAAEEIVASFVHLPTSMRANRNFMARATRYLAEHGLRQFLDIGTGLPTAPNLHEVAQQVAGDCRVVYVDNDPIVLVHARALLRSAPGGMTAYVQGDLHDPETILQAPQLLSTLDLDQPVALSLIAVLQFVTDEREAHDIVRRLVDSLPSGSALVLSTVTADSAPDEVNTGMTRYQAHGIPNKARTKAEVERFFDGLDLVHPGITLVHRWHPDATETTIDDSRISMYGGVAFKP